MIDSLPGALAAFAFATLAIGIAGTRMARVADALADRTGLGEAMIGGLLLAGATSLPDFAATLSAAIDGRPELAMSNVMGSMAANLAFLGVADVVYRKANLEHAAASASNLAQSALLIVLLSLPLVAMAAPPFEYRGIHPVTPFIVVAYIFGLRLVRTTQTAPMWYPRKTPQTVEDVPAAGSRRGAAGGLWMSFGGLTAVAALAGWTLMESAKALTDLAGISDSVAGGLLTALSTSTPELVTTIAAVRAGALTLAVSNIVGTNCFNILVIAAADVAYRPGSIYHDLSPVQDLWGLTAILMSAILLLGMVRRETYGVGRIGFESALLLSVYGGMAAFVLFAGW
jgi:cation:H+ antiporter